MTSRFRAVAVTLLGSAAMCAAQAFAVPIPPAPVSAMDAPAVAPDAMQVFFIDVEGGQSTLFVTPDKHSLLVDTGWDDHQARDAQRIVAAMHLAHIDRLDAVLITHYHLDHVGGVAQLAARVPIGMFLDHGPNRETTAGAETDTARSGYEGLVASGKYAHHVMQPGQPLPVPGFTGTVISADGKVIDHALPGGGQMNPFCADAGQAKPDATENARSLGIVLQWDKARILDLGDLTRDKEKDLMCPQNRLGHVDLLVVSHHGWSQSSSAALVKAITPRVAVMDNGAVKGGSAPVLQTFQQISATTALWQLHASDEGQSAGQSLNAAPAQIANTAAPRMDPAQGNDAAYLLRVAVSRTGDLAVWNSRTGATKDYPAGGR